MHCDKVFYTGSYHPICEDFSFAGEVSGNPLVIISDGCSGSPDTDTGSRLITYAAKQIIAEQGISTPNLGEKVVTTARSSVSTLGLTKECLDATLMVASVAGRWVHVRMYGDGMIISKHQGRIYIEWIQFSKGYPFYPHYLIEPERYAAWKDLEQEITLEKWSIDPDSLEAEHESRQIDVEHEVMFPKEGYDWIAILSDGIGTFSEKPSPSSAIKKVDMIQCVMKLIDFKNFNGVFVERRCNRFKRDCEKWGWTHQDDLSVAAIYIGD